MTQKQFRLLLNKRLEFTKPEVLRAEKAGDYLYKHLRAIFNALHQDYQAQDKPLHKFLNKERE